jgi:DNA-binding CsgD family transcriptional regulator
VDFVELADKMQAVSTTRLLSAQHDGDRRDDALSAVLEALAQVRRETVPAVVLELAPRALCATRVFDRVMVSHIHGSTWLPQALYTAGADGQVALEIDGVVEELEIPLASPLVEAEVVRRRLPALVQDAQTEPRTFAPLVQRTGTREYVVAPVVTGTSVIALLHADSVSTGRPLRDLDRDLLRMFADGVGLIHECAELAERVEAQRRQVAEVCETALRSLQADVASPSLRPAVATTQIESQRRIGAPSRDRFDEVRESSRLSRLTAREREVLALLASGATNAQLADRLTVAESTVKSHVKHILHKLGAGNRAAAIACYLRETRVDERRTR